MAIIIFIAAALIVSALCGFSLTKPDHFRYERKIIITASPEKIFPYLSDLSKGGEWSPWEEMDPDMKRKLSLQTTEPGATYEWEGNSKVGSGRMTILEVIPNRDVKLKLEFFRPMNAVNTAEYSLTPVAGGTEVKWAMYGPNTFVGKLMSVFIDCEKMVGKQFEKGLSKLKTLAEK